MSTKIKYQRIVGKLIYLSHTRTDIAYDVGIISRFMHLPHNQHFEAIIKIIRYLKGTSGKGIFSKRKQLLELLAYTDADRAGERWKEIHLWILYFCWWTLSYLEK